MKKLIFLMSLMAFNVNADFKEATEKEQYAHNRGYNIGGFRVLSGLFESLIFNQKGEEVAFKYRQCMNEISSREINTINIDGIHFFINQENNKCRAKIGL
jgi:hypothetical protein